MVKCASSEEAEKLVVSKLQKKLAKGYAPEDIAQLKLNRPDLYAYAAAMLLLGKSCTLQ